MNDKRNNNYKGRTSSSRKGNQRKAKAGKSDGYADGGCNMSKVYNHPGNDYSWWSKYPELIESASRISFPYKPGMRINDAHVIDITNSDGTTTTTRIPQVIPGICVLDWVPSLGRSTSVTDPISIVAKEIFSRVRAKFSGTLAVDGPDMVMQIMATDSIFMYLSWLKRVYRTVNSISKQNYLFPEKVLEAMGFDNEAIVALKMNKVQLYSDINLLIRYAQKIRCPKLFDVLDRHVWMSEYLYADAPSDMCQIYMFNPKAYFKFELKNSVNAEGVEDPNVKVGGLTQTNVQAVMFTGADVVAELFKFGNALITALAEWEDMYIINGYFERAFEGVPNFTINLLAEDEIISTSYDEDVLSQIENSTTIPGALFSASAMMAGGVQVSVTQQPSTNAIITTPQVNVLKNTLKTPGDSESPAWIYPYDNNSSLISLRSDNPDVRSVVEATRLHQVYKKNPDLSEAAIGVYDIYGGTEIILAYRLKSCSEYDDGRADTSLHTYCVTSSDASTDISATVVQPGHMNLATFDWHPITYTFTVRKDTNTGRYLLYNHTVNGDIHNMTRVSNELMEKMHFNCLLSAFSAFGL